MCFDFLYNISHPKKKRERHEKNVNRCSCELPVILVRFKETEFSDRFSKNIQISDLMKIRLVAPELFYTDGRTDRDMVKLIVAFRNFSNTSKKGLNMEICIHLNSNERCLTATLSKHIWINTALHKNNKNMISKFYFNLQVTSVVETRPLKSKES